MLTYASVRVIGYAPYFTFTLHIYDLTFLSAGGGEKAAKPVPTLNLG